MSHLTRERKMELEEIKYNGYFIKKLPAIDDRYIISDANVLENYINIRGEKKSRWIRLGGVYSTLDQAKRKVDQENFNNNKVAL